MRRRSSNYCGPQQNIKHGCVSGMSNEIGVKILKNPFKSWFRWR